MKSARIERRMMGGTVLVSPLCLPSISYRSLQDQVYLCETSIIDPEPNLSGLLTALAPAAGRPYIRF